MEEMTVPLDTVNDIRSMDAAGRSRSEIARMLHVSRNTVAKYADMEDMSPAAPMPRRRGRPALEGNEEWVAGVLEADLGAPRKQRHTARRIYDRLVAERGYGGSYSTVQRFVRELRLARAAAGGEGYLELEWAPGTCQVDFGNFRAAVGGRTLDLKLLVATLPHSNDRQCVALMSQRSECLCAGLLEIFRRWGRAPAAMVLDNATEAGRMVRGEVTESRLFSQFRAHYRFESRYCNPYSGNEKGSVENAVGFLRRNLLVPVPAFGALPELNAFLAEGCARVNAAARCRDGRPHGEAYREDLAAMRALPGVEFDAVRWVTARADKRGYVEADGREYVAGPAWHGRSLLVGMRASTVEILADRGRRVAVLPRAFGEGPAVRNPLSLGHGHMVKAELLYRDVVFDDEHVAPKLAVEEYLPALLASNSGGLPMYKYLSAYSGEVLNPRMLKEIDEKKDLDAFLNNSLRKAKGSYHLSGIRYSVKSVIANEGFEEAFKKLVLLEEDELDLNELLEYLRALITDDRKIIHGNSELKRLIRMYDFLKYKKAFDISATSE